MKGHCVVIWLMIVSITWEVFAEDRAGKLTFSNDYLVRPLVDNEVQQFARDSERAIRSTPPCGEIAPNRTKEVLLGDDVTITCGCQLSTSDTVKWFDGSCAEVTSQEGHVVIDDVTITISNYSSRDPVLLNCRAANSSSTTHCTDSTSIAAKEKVNQSGRGVAGVAVVIIIAVVIVTSLCLLKKYKTRVRLCMRDTFQANDGNDGKSYDAYLSTGVSETDRKFVNSFANDILRKKCGYNLYVDDKNLLPRLDYSDKLQVNLHKCRRLVVVFSPSYMTHDWCMYCFNEGLRKLVDLHVPMIFVITDQKILTELRSHADVIAHVPQVLLTQYQSSGERQNAIERVRQVMPPPMRSVSFRKSDGMRSPMLSDAESIHKSDINFNSNGSAFIENEDAKETEYRFKDPQIETDMEYDEEIQMEADGPDDFVTAVQTGEEIDPDKVKVHQYDSRKDFYSLTMSGDEN